MTGPRLQTSIIGRGIGFPMRTRAGSVALSAPDDVATAIELVVMTAPGERVMRPDFGCGIWDLVFSPINPSTLGRMEQAVTAALARWEPRIVVEGVVVTPDPERASTVDIDVAYRLRDGNDRRNLVFPFYTLPEESPS